MSSAGWSKGTAVAAAQKSQTGLGYHALFCLQPVSQGTRYCGCLCYCCCGEGDQFHPVLVLSVRSQGEGRPGTRIEVENSWMLSLWPQRMFRAHIRCDRWYHLFCRGRNEIPHIYNTMDSWCVLGITIHLVLQANKHFKFLILLCAYMGIGCWGVAQTSVSFVKGNIFEVITPKELFSRKKGYTMVYAPISDISPTVTTPPCGG